MKFDIGTLPDGSYVLRFTQGSMRMMVSITEQDMFTMIATMTAHASYERKETT